MSLVPDDWVKGVPSAALPTLQATSVDWQVFGVAQTGQLDKANGRTRDAMSIVGGCERRDAAVAERIAAPWWKRPFLRQPDPG